jgi:Ca2+-transporting ATPase
LCFFFVFYFDRSNRNLPTTVAFATFIVLQMFNALNCRSQEKSVVVYGLRGNMMFIYANGAVLLALVALTEIPGLRYIFETTSLPLSIWLAVVAVSTSVVAVDEAR